MHTITIYHIPTSTTTTKVDNITHYTKGLEDDGYRVVRQRTRCYVYQGTKSIYRIDYR